MNKDLEVLRKLKEALELFQAMPETEPWIKEELKWAVIRAQRVVIFERAHRLKRLPPGEYHRASSYLHVTRYKMGLLGFEEVKDDQLN